MATQEKHAALVQELSELEWMIGQWHPVEGMGNTEKDDWEYLILSDPYQRKPSNMVISVADEGHSLMVTYHVDNTSAN